MVKFMKKLAILMTVTLLSLFVLAGCAASPSSGTKYDDLLTKDRGEVYKALELSANDVEEVATGTFLLPGRDNHLGNDYQVTLIFDAEDKLSEFWFMMDFGDRIELAANSIVDVSKRLTKAHGKPNTPEDLAERLSAVEDATEALESGELSRLVETWSIGGKHNLLIEASSERVPDVGVNVTVKYKMQPKE